MSDPVPVDFASIAAVYCSRAEAHAVLQTAAWLQQIGKQFRQTPLHHAVVGVQQQLGRLALLLVTQQSSLALDDKGAHGVVANGKSAVT
jgi:hypothetical protein